MPLSHHWRWRALGCAGLLALGSLPAGAQTHQVRLRAMGPHIDLAAVSYIAQTALPTHLPGNAGKTPRQVMDSFCGSQYGRFFWRAYFKEVRTKNRLPNLHLDEKLPAGSDDFLWPACLFIAAVEQDAFKRVAASYKGRPAPGAMAYRALTGGDGTGPALSNYLPAARSKYVTATVLFTLPETVTAKEFADQARLRARGKDGTQNLDALIREFPLDDKSRGAIIVPIEVGGVGEGAIQSANLVCESNTAAPFGANAVAKAYLYQQKAASQYAANVSVGVVDNGFFGANPYKDPKFGEVFPQNYFTGWNPDLGPVVAAAEGPIYPINYANARWDPSSGDWSPASIDQASGHGTHVAGLVMGGPYIRDADQRTIFMRDGQPWLRLGIANVANGQDQIPADVPQKFASIVGRFHDKGIDIVNMSLAFEENSATGSLSTFQFLFTSPSFVETMFVVAAGNHYSPDVVSSGYYPAALGGAQAPNVMAVAAHDAQGELTGFSDKGKAIDIAAPGCAVNSWLDETGREETLSGTSQAAALVSFTAALLKSLGGSELKVRKLKTRLIASGDMLHGDDFDQIWSQSRLNIRDSLFLFDDFVRVRIDGQEQEWLGTVNGIRGLRCKRGRVDLKQANVFSYRRDEGRNILFPKDSADDATAPCDLAGPATVSFTGTARIGADGDIIPQALSPVTCAVAPAVSDGGGPQCLVLKLVTKTIHR